jgi:hypothetical protein
MLPRMLRLPRLAAAVFASALLSSVAFAQLTQGPPTPLAVNLEKVKIGSSARYSVKVGAMEPMTMSIGLVGRNGGANMIETSIEGGLAARTGKMTTQMTLPSGSSGKVQRMVLQLGDNDPMEMPIQGAQAQQFAKPNPKTFVKTETIKVPAGSFKAKHYHDTTPRGDTVDYWISESVTPIGLVKMEATEKSNPMIAGPISMELVGTGKDAKSAITKPVKPFDQATFMKEMMAGSGAAAAPPAK